MTDTESLLKVITAKSAFNRFRSTLDILALRPPQSLLLEGGTEEERMALALYWAMTANCRSGSAHAGQSSPPCLSCPVCRQIAAGEYLDLWLYDGRISNTQDEDKPGVIKAMRMENIRALKSTLATEPHGGGKRVAIFQGMIQSREEAMNSLLKILEEPSRTTLFALLAPQRGQILPTLVSRSFCLTLPWPDSLNQNAAISSWEAAFAGFLDSGNGFLDKIAGKGAIDGILAEQIILGCQKALVRVLGAEASKSGLDRVFATLGQKPHMASLASQWLDEAQEMLRDTVNPARVLESLASRLYNLLHD